jgi:hypothetical protein
MNVTPFTRLDQMPSPLDKSLLEELSEPAHQVLSKLIQNCSPDPATRTATAAALVLTLWQQRADILSEHVPSLILLNAGEAVRDPIDDFIATFTRGGINPEPQSSKDRYGILMDPEKAPNIMAYAAIERRRLGPASKLDSPDEKSANVLEGRYYDAKRVAYGTGTARAYAKAWSDELGFVTDENDVLIARLNEASDRAAFRSDVITNPDRLHNPIGIGRGLLTVRKNVSVSGSFTEDLWDEELVMGIIKLGLPTLFIPHTATEPLAVSNPRGLNVFPTLWRDALVFRARTSLEQPEKDWLKAHTEDIRRRLRLLPGSGSFEFAVLQVLHQLNSVCSLIARQAGNNYTAKVADNVALFVDLRDRAFRGITLGVAALAWHCLGFDLGCPREKAVKVLRDLRTNGPMSRNEIRRKHHLESKQQRDNVLERLAAEDLVRIEGQTVTAATFGEFVTALYSRPGLPEAVDGDDFA